LFSPFHPAYFLLQLSSLLLQAFDAVLFSSPLLLAYFILPFSSPLPRAFVAVPLPQAFVVVPFSLPLLHAFDYSVQYSPHLYLFESTHFPA
jgi:hypothetical protein